MRELGEWLAGTALVFILTALGISVAVGIVQTMLKGALALGA